MLIAEFYRKQKLTACDGHMGNWLEKLLPIWKSKNAGFE